MLDKLNPFIRYSRLQQMRRSRTGRRIAIDHRLFYTRTGGIYVYCEREYHLPAGSAIYIPAVTPYEIRAEEDASDAMVFDFDLTSDFSVYRDSLHTEELANFDGSLPFSEQLLPGFEKPLYFADAKAAEGMLTRVTELFSDGETPYWREMASAYMKSALLAMLSGSSAAKSPAVRMACEFIRNNYAGEITCDEVARTVGYHPNHLNRLFRQQMDVGLREYIISYRIKEAKKLLTDPSISIADAACACGFSDASYFSQCFRRHVGMTPREFRQISLLP